MTLGIMVAAVGAIVMYDYAFVSGPNAAENRQALATTVQKAGEGLATIASEVDEGIREGFSPPPTFNGQPGGFTLEQQSYPLLTPPQYLGTPQLKPTFPGAPLEPPAPGDLLETFPLVKPQVGDAVLPSRASRESRPDWKSLPNYLQSWGKQWGKASLSDQQSQLESLLKTLEEHESMYADSLARGEYSKEVDTLRRQVDFLENWIKSRTE